MPVIGVTGCFGSGKSTVSGMFARCGAQVFDADKAVHDLLKGSGPAVKAVVKVFGSAVLTAGMIDRGRLAGLVFDDKKKLKALTDILHPFALRQAEFFIRRHDRGSLLVLDVPLLIESGWDRLVDAVVVVKASQKLQLERLRKRSGTTRVEALKRIRLQMPLAKKLKFADHVVDNSGSRSETYKQVREIIKGFLRKQQQHRRGI